MKNGSVGQDNISSEERALAILDDPLEDQLLREKAVRYLSYRPGHRVIQKLVQTLEDEDFGVRFEAAVALTQMGEKALPELLKALTDAKTVSDPRLREGAYYVLHYNRSSFPAVSVTKLI